MPLSQYLWALSVTIVFYSIWENFLRITYNWAYFLGIHKWQCWISFLILVLLVHNDSPLFWNELWASSSTGGAVLLVAISNVCHTIIFQHSLLRKETDHSQQLKQIRAFPINLSSLLEVSNVRFPAMQLNHSGYSINLLFLLVYIKSQISCEV